MIMHSPSKRLLAVGLVVLFGLAFWAYSTEHSNKNMIYEPYYFIGEVVVAREVVRKEYRQELVTRDERGSLVFVRTSRYPEYQFGQVLLLECQRYHPDRLNTDDFAYGRYLRMQGIDAICEDAIMNTKNVHTGFSVLSGIIWLRDKTGKAVRSIWPEPHASFVAGILYGDRAGLPKDVQEQFRIAGLTHIMVVSGYNVTIVANIIMSVLRGVGIGRKKSFIAVLVCVVLFVIFVGASASAVRAGIMGVVALLGKTLGRGSRAGPVIIVSVLAMVVGNPLLLVYDMGLHLSVLATMGLIYIAPLVEPGMQWIPERFGLREAVSTTIAASIVTTPLISSVFGTVSLISIAANLVVLPVIPVLMVASAVAVGVGAIIPFLGKLIGVVAWGLSTYVIWIVEHAAQVPFASITIVMQLPVVIMVYSVLILWWYLKKQKPLVSWSVQ